MATVNNLYIDQGATFSAVIQVFDEDGDFFNLTGFSVASQIRKTYTSSSVSATFTAQVLGAANGTINLSLTHSQTAGLKAGRYVYDVEITKNEQIMRAAEGIVVVYPNVTR